MADDGGAIGNKSVRHERAAAKPPLLALLGGALVALLVLLIVAVGLNDDDAGGVFDGDDEAEVVASSSDEEGKIAAAPSTTVPPGASTTVPAEEPMGAAGEATACPHNGEVGASLFGDIESVVGCEVDVTVTVSGVLDDRTFAAKELGGEVVVMDTSPGEVLRGGQDVRVVGRVVAFAFAEHADELGLEGGDEETYSRFEGKALVVAESTTPA